MLVEDVTSHSFVKSDQIRGCFPKKGAGVVVRECLCLIEIFHFHFPSDVASSFPCYKYFIYIPFKMILQMLCFAMLNCNVLSRRNTAFFINEILRKSTCNHEIFHLIGKAFSIKIPENSNAQCVQIILSFNCSNMTIKDFWHFCLI